MSKTDKDITKQAGEEHEEFYRQQGYSREECETLADMVKSQPTTKDQDEGDFITAWQSHDTELGDQPLNPAQAHTPGPWYQLTGRQGHTNISHSVSWDWSSEANYVGEVTDANARLIAAAPDLLTACLVALDRLNRLDDAGTGAHSPAYYQIQNAVIKAGRSKPQ